MTRWVYVSGRYRRYDDALVHAEDRGFQFADSVYEVMEVRNSKLVDATRHLTRLERSLGELKIPPPMARQGLLHVIGEIVRRNLVRDGLCYLQVTRGAAPRDFAMPSAETQPTLVVLARAVTKGATDAKAKTGISVKTVPETRWARSDIKTVMLLPSVLAKASAKADGAGEAWYVDEAGYVTEGASSNAWIVTDGGKLMTRQTGPEILPGVTRATLKDVAASVQVEVVERPFTVEEAQAAREAFVTSASLVLMPVVKIDGALVADGRPGPTSLKLRALFHGLAETSSL
ncbi:MAG: D-amino-acid transaminase [Hyphomicrobium aestuarii]|nr:D-amino-acid transaminase [Hyphomicrobium aestuarii]